MTVNKGYLTAKTDKASDEVKTPECAIIPLIKYLRAKTIWCPFDKREESNYVKIFEDVGFDVIASHIDNGQNFFTFEPKEEYDIIISNPPFSLKDEVLKRLVELNKPFAILLPLPALQGIKRFSYLKSIRNIQLIIFDKRVNFIKNGEVQKGSPFASIYLCNDFLSLDRNIIFEEINDKL